MTRVPAIDWAGICHSDIHTVRGDWGPQHYPHTVVPDVEVITADSVNEAWGSVLRSDVRYRFVIDVASLRTA